MERILTHWMNLDRTMPSLFIVCPKEMQDIAKPIYGVHNDGCPNLIWELRRTRREEVGPIQLAKKNPSEKIVDKENHLRDCLKYLVLTLPEPARKSIEMQVAEHVKHLAELGDLTSAYVRGLQKREELEGVSQPTRPGRWILRHGRRWF